MENPKAYQMTIGACDSIHKKAIVFRLNPREDGNGGFVQRAKCAGGISTMKDTLLTCPRSSLQNRSHPDHQPGYAARSSMKPPATACESTNPEWCECTRIPCNQGWHECKSRRGPICRVLVSESFLSTAMIQQVYPRSENGPLEAASAHVPCRRE